MNKLFNFFKKKIGDVDLRFFDLSNQYYFDYPILKAKDALTSLKKKQSEANGSFSLPSCPGMFDYAKIGYVITSPADIYLKANKAGTATSIDPMHHIKSKRTNRNFMNAATKYYKELNPLFPDIFGITPMDHDIPYGLFEYNDGVPKNAWKLGLTWRAESCNDNMAGVYLLPPFYHNPDLLNYIYVYPGNVDTGMGFGTINIIFSIRKKCEYIIRAGDPLLHVIPYSTDQNKITATYGPCNLEVGIKHNFVRYSEDDSWYMKHYMYKKKYGLKLHDSSVEVTFNRKDDKK